ncbi:MULTISPECIES: ASCH domain-containing protein [Vibrio]|uniref:ASCH domain-containing protein n=2 Tax=Vibrio TaxID=662 RepID=A0A7X4LKS2_9VIBR|nr:MULTISPECIES: ASCH domain-containing protein [Vibrio]MBF9002757.1 ASCH domain-containing protein [Vibrio nitrifigilis]MZI93752.1 ASCH domain-containing protein [Vibrio eleionomae]
MDSRSKTMLEQYLASIPKEKSQQYTQFTADYFCANEESANVCAELIVKGEKRATCSMDYWYSVVGEPRPQVGALLVVTRWDGEPVCVVETTSVATCRYCDVTEEFAAAEGEGDKSLRWWKEAHWDFFSAECKDQGMEPSEEMLLVLEHFDVVYRP